MRFFATTDGRFIAETSVAEIRWRKSDRSLLVLNDGRTAEASRDPYQLVDEYVYVPAQPGWRVIVLWDKAEDYPEGTDVLDAPYFSLTRKSPQILSRNLTHRADGVSST